jgi:hypothetical protein
MEAAVGTSSRASVQTLLEFLPNGEKSLKITGTKKCHGVNIYLPCPSSPGRYLSETVGGK